MRIGCILPKNLLEPIKPVFDKAATAAAIPDVFHYLLRIQVKMGKNFED